MKKRVWELDAFRGLCVLGMVVVHFVYDLVELYGIVDWKYPEWFSFIKDWGGLLFILISGICATLGKRSVRRGAIVILCGMICTAVTYGMWKLGMAWKGIIIYFGVLHCLGSCMILWWAFKKLPTWTLALLGVMMAAAGLQLQEMTFDVSMWWMPFGIISSSFASSDYFPLLPNFGFFLLGAVLGRTVYGKKESLLPKVDEKKGILAFLCGCGKHSLWIYLLHQPILAGICMGLSYLV